jgi:hypothetical protein
MSKDDNEELVTEALSPEFRVSFPQLFEAKAMEEGGKEKHSVTMLFSKKTSLKKLQAIHDNALTIGIDELWKGKKPKNLRNPFRDGDEEESYCEKEGYPGHIFIKATSIQKPSIVSTEKDEEGDFIAITDPMEVYAGCYGRAYLVAKAYDYAGNKGVAFYIQHFQKTGDGDHFSGRKNVQDVFDDEFSDDDEDFE